MGWMTKLPDALPPTLHNMEAIIPFKDGSVYSQVDLDGHDAVSGVAKFYLFDDSMQVGYFAAKAINTNNRANERSSGSYAVYIKKDPVTENPLAMVYEREG